MLRKITAILLAAMVVTGAESYAQEIDICDDSRANCIEVSNKRRIGLISGSARGTYIRVADDISRIVGAYQSPDFDEGERLRVVPMVGRGSIKNIEDLLYLSSTDVGLVQADVLELFRQANEADGRFGDVLQRIHYLTPVYDEEIHVVCRRGACGRTFGEVTEDVVLNLGPKGSGTALTATLIATELGFSAENFRYFGYEDALSFMKKPGTAPDGGRVDGMFFVAGKPVSLFRDIAEEDGLELVELTEAPASLDMYVPGVIEESDDYRGLLGSRAFVRTLAVPAVLAVYGGEYRDRTRTDNLRVFCRALVESHQEFRDRARDGRVHPKWADWDPSRGLGSRWRRHPLMVQALAAGH